MAKVLVVDDSPLLRLILINSLKRHGDEIIGEAGTSADAIKLCRKHKPDIVIKDLYMPDDDGVSTIIKMLKVHKKVKIIVCSTFEQKQMIIAALKAGAHDFILKPFQDSQVWRVLEGATKKNSVKK